MSGGEEMLGATDAGGVYSKILRAWCHEGFEIFPNEDGTWTGRICSYSVIGYTPNECAEKMAEHVKGVLKADPECGGC